MRPGPCAGTTAALRRAVAPRLPAFRMAPNSSLFRIRRSRPNRALPVDTWANGLLWASGVLSPQALPALGPAPLDDESSAARSHADEEAVCPSSATVVGLERSLHCSLESLPKGWNLRCYRVKPLSSKRPLPGGRRRGAGVLWLPSLARQTSCPILSCFSRALWLIR